MQLYFCEKEYFWVVALLLAKRFNTSQVQENLARVVDDYYAFCAKQIAEGALFVHWKPDSEHFDRILPK